MHEHIDGSDRPRPTRTHERGFSLIEILVALIITAILLAVLVSTFGGAKSTTYRNEAKAAGSAYLQAVSQYQADFANNVPPTTGPNRWSSAPVTIARRGPLNLMGKPYLASPPDGVADGRIGVSVAVPAQCTGSTPATTPPPGATPKTQGWVIVCYAADSAGTLSQAFVHVRARKGEDPNAWSSCYLGSTTFQPRC